MRYMVKTLIILPYSSIVWREVLPELNEEFEIASNIYLAEALFPNTVNQGLFEFYTALSEQFSVIPTSISAGLFLKKYEFDNIVCLDETVCKMQEELLETVGADYSMFYSSKDAKHFFNTKEQLREYLKTLKKKEDE